MDLMEMLGKAALESDEWSPSGTAGEMVEALEAGIEAYLKPCPFQVGDLITPKKVSNTKGRGRPYKVMEVLPEKKIARDPEDGAPIHEYDIVVGMMHGEIFCLFRKHSSEYEPWDPKKVGK